MRSRSHGPNLNLTTFAGIEDPENYLLWEKSMGRAFECYKYSESRKVVYAAAHFTNQAHTWWDKDTMERRRRGEGSVPSWEVMKYMMKKRFGSRAPAIPSWLLMCVSGFPLIT
ncbi:hypothetical protein V5N11_002943 [Cardamine amara subsp. amara]|uniref:Retrotransposon Copia-like N-terminal domain-containing protein n=1 Tax=Cardamine amara subsp. amara TaxID=228776 RepID=A0ABD0ZVN4_CARAN